MRRGSMVFALFLLACSSVPPGAAGTVTATEPPATAARPAQSPSPSAARVSRPTLLESAHFIVVYRPEKLSAAQAATALREAERGWERCVKLFGPVVRDRIRLDLTPDLAGASGVTHPGDPSSPDPEKRPRIDIRYAELEYLGLTSEYLLTHEIAHVFTLPLARSTLGEGIADWAAGAFSGIPLRPWWGRALRESGLWVPPEALFVTGEFETGDLDADPEAVTRFRTTRYTECGLLVQHLVERFGWEKVRAFAADYGEARGWLGAKPVPDPGSPALGVEAARQTFRKHFGVAWETLRAGWERQMEEDPAPEGEARRLVLAQRLYGAVRSYELWKLRRKQPVDAGADAEVRASFVDANRALRAGDVEGAEKALREARTQSAKVQRAAGS